MSFAALQNKKKLKKQKSPVAGALYHWILMF